MRILKALFLLMTISLMGCNHAGNIDDTHNNNDKDDSNAPQLATGKVLGADLSQWLAYKNDGAEWYVNGTAIDDLPRFFAEASYDVARLRLFVNPDLNSTACQDLDYVLESARVMRDAGMTICLDFHYSDTWADPAKQYKPEAWKALDITALIDKVYSYTLETLNTFKQHNIPISLIQIGNEITYGMLWDSGRIELSKAEGSNLHQVQNLTNMLHKASQACREVYPEAKIIIHTDRSCDTQGVVIFHDFVATIDYDIIGLSFYPYFHGTMAQLSNTLTELSTKYHDKEIMIMETGYGYNGWSNDKATVTHYDQYPENSAGQNEFIVALNDTLNKYPQVTGLFYWFPEETKIDWRSPHRIDFNQGLFDKDTGEVFPAFYSMALFKGK